MVKRMAVQETMDEEQEIYTYGMGRKPGTDEKPEYFKL